MAVVREIPPDNYHLEHLDRVDELPSLGDLRGLTTLIISNTARMPDLTRALESSTSLTALDVRGSPLEGDAARALADALLANHSIREFGGVPLRQLRALPRVHLQPLLRLALLAKELVAHLVARHAHVVRLRVRLALLLLERLGVRLVVRLSVRQGVRQGVRLGV